MGNPQPLIRSDQVLYEITEPTPGDYLTLRPATDKDRSWVTHAAAEMMKEDFGVDRLGVDPELFRRRIQTSIRARREIIGEVDDQPVFRVNVGTMCRYGAQLGGTWIEPRFRGQGIGKAAMRSTAARLLEDVPRVTLHVRHNNDAAIGCYSAVGFRPSQAFRLLSR
jgi:predicted GNAT family acetyltransferase